MKVDFVRTLQKALADLQAEKVVIDRQIMAIRRILATEVDDRRMRVRDGRVTRRKRVTSGRRRTKR
jgi:hypothetical protein